MIQDIEAEDHIIGPLSLRQFIYALISAFFLYICFLVISKHLAVLLVVFLPPALFTGFFAFPFGGDQPTEVWALAKIRFMFKPRTRIWDQSGVKELVTITVPKKIERNLTNGLSQTEVKSRLSALANTIDSRGWAVKNVNVNLYANPGSFQEASDRLIDVSSLPREVPSYDVSAADDMMDERSNPIAQQFDSMINASAQAHHQQLIERMNSSTPVQTTPPAGQATPGDYWFLNQNPPASDLPAGQAVFSEPTVVSPGTPASAPTVAAATPDISDTALLNQLHAREANEQTVTANLHTLQPLAASGASRTPATPSALVSPQPATAVAPAVASPPTTDPAILNLAGNNDLNIATLARQAGKSQHHDDGEVVISLR